MKNGQNLEGKPSTTTKTVKVWTLREAIQQQKTVKVFFKVKTLREAFQNKLVKVWKKIVKVWSLREAFKKNCESLDTETWRQRERLLKKSTSGH